MTEQEIDDAIKTIAYRYGRKAQSLQLCEECAELVQVVREALDYARLKGIGQWRNSGRGRATWEEVR